MVLSSDSQFDARGVRDIATADLSPARRPVIEALEAAGVGNRQRMASELELEYRRYLVMARRAGARPAASAAVRAYASIARSQGLIEPDDGPEMTHAETAELYDSMVPYGNRELFLGQSEELPAVRAVNYRESVATDSPTTWRVGSLPTVDLSVLREDANSACPTARRVDNESFGVDVDGRLYSPSRTRFADSEETAWQFFSSPDFLAELFRLAGEPLFLVRTSYLVYEDEDFLGMHTDGAQCKYVVLMSISGEVPPLNTYASLRGASSETLVEVAMANSGFPEPDETVPITSEPLLMRGAHLPHARATHRGRPIRLASACFDTLTGTPAG
ncbi:hypothetical protein ACGFIW_19450 [Micromonospora sp. NPDC048935]|uniref:hypothetical protein n=1 Tax=Micromonospora sp. NPDC048935 TaxID=3364262 RepID=UPI00370F9A65